MSAPPRLSARIAAVLRQRCPRCRRGPVFSGWLRMSEACPACGHRFEREPGYFVGAMYISYALAVATYLAAALAIHWLAPQWSAGPVLASALPPLLVLAPVIHRYSRVLWMHLDWAIHPVP